MFKKMKSKLFWLLSITLFSSLFVGCSDKKSLNVNYVSTYLPRAVDGTCDLIDSNEELFDFINEEETDLDKLNKYDDNYFSNHSLVIFENVEGSSGNKSEIKSYAIENDTITIHIETESYGNTCDMAYAYFILELDKKDTTNIDDINIIKNGKLLNSHRE